MTSMSRYLTLGLIPLLLGAFSFTGQGRLIIKVKGCRSDRGKIMIALYDDASSFDKNRNAMYHKVIAIENGQAEVVFDQLPPGDYAYKIYHDENTNEKLDKNLLGIPKEGFGFSNNAKVRFGPPKFRECVMKIHQTAVSTVRLQYLSY